MRADKSGRIAHARGDYDAIAHAHQRRCDQRCRSDSLVRSQALGSSRMQVHFGTHSALAHSNAIRLTGVGLVIVFVYEIGPFLTDHTHPGEHVLIASRSQTVTNEQHQHKQSNQQQQASSKYVTLTSPFAHVLYIKHCYHFHIKLHAPTKSTGLALVNGSN